MNLIVLGLIILMGVVIYDYIRIIMFGFRVSFLWGVLLIVSWLIPILFFLFYIFCIKHFNEVQKPFIRIHVVLVLIAVTFFLLKGP